MVEVIDDFISKQQADEIEQYFMSTSFKWNYLENTVSTVFRPRFNYTDKLVDSEQLVNLILGDTQIYDEAAFSYIKPIIDRVIELKNIKDLYIDRVKANTLFQNKEFKSEFFNCPHTDLASNETNSLIYYINHSDGDTYFFNNFIQESNFDLEVDRTVTPTKGRAVLFKSNQYHASSNPINSKRRLVINIIFKAYG